MYRTRLTYTDWQDGYDPSRPLVITPAKGGLAIVITRTRLRAAALSALMALHAEPAR